AAKAIAYVGRFVTKTSPNGVFCATTRADLSGTTARVQGENRFDRVDVRLSVAEARKITACLAIDVALENVIVPRPNPTARREHGGWTFWKTASPRHADDTEVRARVGEHPLLALFLEEATRGVHTVPALIDAVGRRCSPDPGPEALLSFHRKLVAH